MIPGFVTMPFLRNPMRVKVFNIYIEDRLRKAGAGQFKMFEDRSKHKTLRTHRGIRPKRNIFA